MPTTYKFHRLAAAEAQDAIDYHGEVGFSGRFLLALSHTIGLVTTHPEVGRSVLKTRDGRVVRQFRMQRYRYVLVWTYSSVQNHVTIWAVAHTARRPRYWVGRLRSP